MTTSPADAAQTAADEARQDVAAAERQLAEGGTVSFARLHKLRDRARHLDLEARGERTRAERKRAEQRAADLAELGEEIDALAVGENLAELRRAVEDVASACARVHRLADNHDAALAELCASAVALHVEPPAPGGPRESSAFIALTGKGASTGIIHRRTQVYPVAGQILAALGQAQDGNPGEALKLLNATNSTRPAWRPTCLVRNQAGSVLAMNNVTDIVTEQIASGELVRLSERDIDKWMDGELT